MERFMAVLLNMSLAASFTAIFVMILRLFLKRLPKSFSYVLWGVVFLRLLCPFAVESSLSILPWNPSWTNLGIHDLNMQIKAGDGAENQTEAVGLETAGSEGVKAESIVSETAGIHPDNTELAGIHAENTKDDGAVNSEIKKNNPKKESTGITGTETSVSEDFSKEMLQFLWILWIFIWELGVLAFFFYYLFSWRKLSWMLGSAVEKEPGVYESREIQGSFIAGFIKPRIYLSSDLEGNEREYILMHERMHIQRRDYLVKAAAFVALSLHWFNPLVWVSVILMEKDMEMSCDEKTLQIMGMDAKKDYSFALLHAAEKRSGFILPLAFGESNTKKRVRNILNYKKPTRLAAFAAVLIIGIAVLALITDPKITDHKTINSAGNTAPSAMAGETIPSEAKENPNTSVSVIGGSDGPASIFVAGKPGNDFTQQPDMEWLSSQQLYKDTENKPVTIDFASEDTLIFHGTFGMFAFQKEGEYWNMSMYAPNGIEGVGEEKAENNVSYSDETNRDHEINPQWDFDTNIAANGESSGEFNRETNGENNKEISEEIKKMIGSERNAQSAGVRNKFILNQNVNFRINDYDVWNMNSGSTAIIGTCGSSNRLADLFYGYYNPEDNVMTQVYLFGGSKKEIVNPPGFISEQNYLFSRDGYDYFVRTPAKETTDEEKNSQTLQPAGIKELIRCRDGFINVLDTQVLAETSKGLAYQAQIIDAGSRIIYTGVDTKEEIKNPRYILYSIENDGSDKKAAALSGLEYTGLCYDQGYLYYEENKNQNVPKTVYQMSTDFGEQKKMAEIDGNLITVVNGDIYYLDSEKPAICIKNLKDGSDITYDKWGRDASTYQCIYAKPEESRLFMQFMNRFDSQDIISYDIHLKGEAGLEYLNSIFKVEGGGTEIFCMAGLNQWNGLAYDRSDSFKDLAAMDREIPYLEAGETVKLRFTEEGMPNTWSLYDYVLNEEGKETYRNVSPDQIVLLFEQGTASFELEHHHAEVLDSSLGNYGEGNLIRGFKLICTWGDNECEYAWLIRTDK